MGNNGFAVRRDYPSGNYDCVEKESGSGGVTWVFWAGRNDAMTDDDYFAGKYTPYSKVFRLKRDAVAMFNRYAPK